MAVLKPTFSLTIGGFQSSTDNAVGGPTRLVVERDMDIAADGLLVRLMDQTGIALGDEVTLKLGHDGDEQTVFTGIVVAQRPAIGRVEVRALGKMNALLNLYGAATYDGQTPGSIARDLIGQAGLSSGTIDDGPTLPRYALDTRLSAFAHLKGLADRLGYEFYTDRDGKVMFHALGPAADLDSAGGGLLGAATGAVSSLLGGGGEGYAFGQHLIDAAADREPAAWDAVDVGGESPMSGQGDRTEYWLTTDDSTYRGSAGSGSIKLLTLDALARTKDLADRFAAGRLAVAARRAHQIRIRVLGRPQVDLGDDISTSDLPDDLVNASGYVRAIRHIFAVKSGFVTDFSISVSA